MTRKPFQSVPHRMLMAFTALELLLTVVIVAILMALLFAGFGTVRLRGEKASCAANLRQVGLAALAFAHERNGVLPDSKNWQGNAGHPDSIARYLMLGDDPASRRTPSALTCPTDQKRHPSNREYCRTYAINLYAPGSTSGATQSYHAGRLSKATSFSRQAFFTDGAASVAAGVAYYQTAVTTNNFTNIAPFTRPHGDGLNVVFLDGHIEFLAPQEADQTLSNPALPFWVGNP